MKKLVLASAVAMFVLTGCQSVGAKDASADTQKESLGHKVKTKLHIGETDAEKEARKAEKEAKKAAKKAEKAAKEAAAAAE